MNEDSGYIDCGGYSLAYQIEGRGTSALIIGSALYYPRVFSKSLRDKLRMVFLDHRGFAAGPDVGAREAPSLETMLEDIEFARKKLGLERFIIIGHSGHSYMALEYAKKYPEHVSHVVMIGISPDLSQKNQAAAEQAWDELIEAERKAIMAENVRKLPDEEIAKLSPSEAFIKSYVRNGPRTWYNPGYDATELWRGIVIHMGIINHIWGDVFQKIDIREGLENFAIPVFLALGKYDYLVAPPTSWETVRANFQNLTLRVFSKSGHTPPLETPEEFDSELLAWVEQYSEVKV